MKNTLIHILITVIVSVSTALLIFAYLPQQAKAPTLIGDYYASETATLVSPHSLRKKMHEGIDDFVLVDVRSTEEYEQEHIVGAVSIPAYVDRENSAKTDLDRVVDDFRALSQENSGKEIIVYCYSSSCMTGRKIGNALAQSGIYVKEMTIGWNEWRHFWKQWNYPHEWENINPEDYVATGKEPGEFDNSKIFIEPCSIDNEFGC